VEAQKNKNVSLKKINDLPKNKNVLDKRKEDKQKEE
jgi:hypothetical protein